MLNSLSFTAPLATKPMLATVGHQPNRNGHCYLCKVAWREQHSVKVSRHWFLDNVLCKLRAAACILADKLLQWELYIWHHHSSDHHLTSVVYLVYSNSIWDVSLLQNWSISHMAEQFSTCCFKKNYILHLLNQKKWDQILLLLVGKHHLIEVKSYKIILNDFSSAFFSS